VWYVGLNAAETLKKNLVVQEALMCQISLRWYTSKGLGQTMRGDSGEITPLQGAMKNLEGEIMLLLNTMKNLGEEITMKNLGGLGGEISQLLNTAKDLEQIMLWQNLVVDIIREIMLLRQSN
jgi:hypothetical protein